MHRRCLVIRLDFENTAIGKNALWLNDNGSQNVAVGVDALVNIGSGSYNTAVGHAALSNNGAGTDNTAIGLQAMLSNDTGIQNTAVGNAALAGNTDGINNTAVGFGALINSTGSGSIAIGSNAGEFVGSSNNVIAIGSPGDDVDNSCFIGNISGVEVKGVPVVVDANGQLGVAPAGSPLSANELLKQQRVVQELKATTERQAAVIALQEGQIKALTAGLQKVSAQLEASKPAPQMVKNNRSKVRIREVLGNHR